MAAIMSQLLPNHFPLSVSDIRLVMQNAEAHRRMPMLSANHHPDRLDHFTKSSNHRNLHDDGDSDSDVSVGQENDEISDVSSEHRDGTQSRTPDCLSPDGSSMHEERIKRGSVDFTEDTSNDSRFTRLCSPQRSEDDPSSIRVPPILRPSPTRLHEEFIRNSQLYAEELMRQQISLVAASQGNVVFPKLAAATATRPFLDDKLGAYRAAAANHLQTGLNYRTSGIHNHLNAISQITQNLTNSHDIYKITSPSLSSEASQSPPIFPAQQSAAAAAAAAMLMNNNLSDQNLKFGIDNILKADFGCRITDPLKRKSSKKKVSAVQRRSPSPTLKADRIPINLTRENVSRDSALEKMDSMSQKSLSPPATATSGGATSSNATSTSGTTTSTTSSGEKGPIVWPAWVYCTRYSDRPSSGRSPRTRKPKKPPSEKGSSSSDDKRPRTAFSGPQLARLKHEFAENRYLTERRRQQLSAELGLNEAQIKIWFQNKRAKIKKSTGHKNPLALQLMAQGLYNHSTIPLTREEEELQELQAAQAAKA